MVEVMARVLGTSVLLVLMGAMSPGGKAPATSIAALRQLEKGRWELRDRGTKRDEPPRQQICVGDPSQLLQVRVGATKCSRFIVSNATDRAVVTYQCKGGGNGRTDLRIETPRLVQIDAQGVADGAPFALSLEGRRTGDCP